MSSGSYDSLTMFMCSPAARIEMTSPTKSELDYEDSDDEPSLPLNADPTDAVVEEGEIDSTHTDLTHGPSEVSETRPGSISEPLSPGTARKRGFDEVHRKSQLPVLTTTPQKTPPKSIAFPYRAASEPQAASNPFRQPFEKAGFSALRNVMYAESPPPSTGATVVDRDATQSLTADTEQGQRSFTQEVKSYEQELDNEFREFEKQLESRDRSAELVALDWDDLERRFTNAIDPLVAEEDKIRQELGHRLQVIAKRRDATQCTEIYSNSSYGCRFLVKRKANEPSKGVHPCLL